MCCEDAFVNYNKLHEINIEREKIDELKLTSLDLTNERNGSIIGSMLDERHLLLRQADFNLNCL